MLNATSIQKVHNKYSCGYIELVLIDTEAEEGEVIETGAVRDGFLEEARWTYTSKDEHK